MLPIKYPYKTIATIATIMPLTIAISLTIAMLLTIATMVGIAPSRCKELARTLTTTSIMAITE